jgi:L-alanine-DL-glutamate epimerase-like enolase superfamily enzyme
LLQSGNRYFVRTRSADGAEGVIETKDIEDYIPILLRRVIPEFGGKVALMADANGSYDAANGIEMGKRLQEMKYLWFEEPCPWEELSWDGARLGSARRTSVGGISTSLFVQVAGVIPRPK